MIIPKQSRDGRGKNLLVMLWVNQISTPSNRERDACPIIIPSGKATWQSSRRYTFQTFPKKSSIAGPNCFHPQLGVQRLFSDALFPGPPDFSNEDE
jgi:hypothetical protein